MITEQRATLRCRESADGRRLILSGYSPDLLELYHSLPDARFHRESGTWSCLNTPATRWRIAFAQGEQYVLPSVWDGTPALVSKTDAWPHQWKAFAKMAAMKGGLLGLEMGTGKTKVAVDLTVCWKAKTILVLCPKSVLPVWRREFARHAASPVKVTVLEGGSVKRRTADADAALAWNDNPVAIVLNYDAARCDPFKTWSLSRQWDVVILDESHRVKAHNSQISKYVAKLGRQARYRLCLTGTPMGQSPLDVFGQFRFLDPGVFGTSWTNFSQRYALHLNPAIPQMVTGYRNQEELQERMSWYTYRCRAADVLSLPAKHHIDRRFALGFTAQQIYRDMEKELIAEIGDEQVTASNCLVKMIRLQQITSGFVQPDETEQLLDIDESKAETLAELVEDMDKGEPLVVFCRFRHDLDVVARIAGRTGRVYGELSGRRRDALDDDGCLAKGVTLAGVQIQSGGLGVDFSRARYACYYSLGFSLLEYDQSIARLHRPGQTRTVHYYHLICEKTIDEYVYAALQKRREIIEEVLSYLDPRHEETKHEDSI